WLVAVVGLVAALVGSRVAVGIGRDSDGTDRLVHGCAGPGTSLVLAGRLVAVLGAAGGLRGRLSHADCGWRQAGAAVASVSVLLALTVTATGYTPQVLAERAGTADSNLLQIGSRGASPVPALGLELQGSAQQPRVLMLTGTASGVQAQLWRG